MENGYAICFNEWALDDNIKNELRLLIIISSLTAKDGYCFASNQYFVDLFNESEQSISRKIKKLEKYNYIVVDYTKRGCQVLTRKIRLTKLFIDDKQICSSTINKIVKENNISINKKENNNINIITKERFTPPTLEEIKDYIQEKKMNVSAEKFYDYFTEGKWVDSKGKKVKNWKQKLITWNSYTKKQNDSVPEWFDKKIESEQLSKEEENELENELKEILKGFE